jgi:hypothetical protein
VRDRDHPMAQRRFLLDVPAGMADEIVRLTPFCELMPHGLMSMHKFSV